MKARLLLAFLGVTLFSVLAAAAGLYAFAAAGARLDTIDRRVPPMLSALDLSRAAERIVAVAPALLASVDRERRDAIGRELSVEAERLRRRLSELTGTGSRTQPLDTLATTASALLDSLAGLEAVVARQVVLGERMKASQARLFEVNAQAGRLLEPWQQVLREQVARRVERLPDAAPRARAGQVDALATLIDLRQSTQNAQRLFSAAVDPLLEASASDRI